MFKAIFFKACSYKLGPLNGLFPSCTGVGKTSIARSIARALQREVRAFISLTGPPSSLH